jgi:hypothetical protein
MSLHSLDIALREICETKQLLESLLISSETFNYPKAKLALKALQKKSKELASIRASLEFEQRSAAVAPNVIQLSRFQSPAH